MKGKKSKTKKDPDPNETEIKFVKLVDYLDGPVMGYSLYDPNLNQVIYDQFSSDKAIFLGDSIHIAMPGGSYCVPLGHNWEPEEVASLVAFLIEKPWVDIDTLRELISILQCCVCIEPWPANKTNPPPNI